MLTAMFFQFSASQNLVPVYRISTLYGEYFRYDAADLRKVDVERSTVLLTVCGRNRVTTQGQPIACLSLPLASYAEMTTAEWYPLKYQILLPSGYDVTEDMQSTRESKSWEEKGIFKEYYVDYVKVFTSPSSTLPGLAYERSMDVHLAFLIKPLKETNPGVVQASFDP